MTSEYPPLCILFGHDWSTFEDGDVCQMCGTTKPTEQEATNGNG